MVNPWLTIMAVFGGLMFGKVVDFLSGKQKRYLVRFAPVGRHFKFDDLLVSTDFPKKIKQYRPTKIEWQNAKRLGKALDPLVDKFGKPIILSGGRPPSVGDFYTTLRKRGLDPSPRSQHNNFAAVDAKWSGDTSSLDAIYNRLKDRPEFLQVIYYRKPGKSYFHLSVPEPERPNIPRLRLIKQ